MDLSGLKNKDHLTIIITDSGLGGLSVHALLDKNLRGKTSKNIDLIYFNSLADRKYGYNSLKHKQDKIKIFNSALEGMLKYKPDAIFIACNTLSVLYDQTEISKKINFPIIGIVESGIELILENTIDIKNCNILVFGTETTIKSNQHKINLVGKGFDEKNIITQACKNLESEIQNDANSHEVRILIQKCVNEAFEKIENKYNHNLVLLACSHYGYSKNIFEEQLNKICPTNFSILNPNEKMAGMLNEFVHESINLNGKINNKVLSRVKSTSEQILNISKLLELDSKSVAGAFTNYEYNANLFFFDQSEIKE